MKKKLLITGSEGYVGKYMVKALADDYDLVLYDLALGNNLFDLTSVKGMDVLHLAAQTSVQESFASPQGYYFSNVLATAHLARLCMAADQKLYYFSSAAAIHPDTSPYALSKAHAHDIVERLMPKLRGVVFVPFNIYSEDPKRGTVLDHFLHDKEIYVNGKGYQERDFIHINDVTRIVKAAIDEDWSGHTIQLGTGEPQQILGIAESFANYTGKKIIHQPPVKEIRNSVADIYILKQFFKEKLTTNLEHDIKRMTVYN